jgi:hypothetical protein
MTCRDYLIVASPSDLTVSPGAKVTYHCQQKYDTIDYANAPRNQFQWYCVNDAQAAAKLGKPTVIKGPAGHVWKDATWGFPGRHHVQCHVIFPQGGSRVFEYVQCLEHTEAIMGREWERARREGTESAEATQNALRRYVQILEAIENHVSIDDPKQKENNHNLVKAYKVYLSKLEKLLAPTNGKIRYPIRAVHLATETQQKTHLRVFVSYLGEEKWCLVDWTNPTDRTLSGTYEGTGKNDLQAIEDAIEAWNKGLCGNRYPKGLMKYEVPSYVINGNTLSDQFETTGRSNLDAITNVLEWVGIISAASALVVAIVAVPGSAFVAGAIWTSIFTSTAAAGINIYQRHNEGFSNLHDDAFDTLTIVANLFAGSGAWMRGASVSYRLSANGKILKGVIIGNIGTASVQGVILGADYINEFDQIMSDKSLLPNERTSRLLELFRKAAIAATLTYVSMQGNAKDLENLNVRPKHLSGELAATPAEKIQKLKDPTAHVDLTKSVPIEGHTSKGKLTGKVQKKDVRPALLSKKTPGGGTTPPENTISIFAVEGRGTYEMLKSRKIKHAYLYTGHVGFSFDGGETIWAFSPHAEGMSAVEVVESLRDKVNKANYPGKIKNDRGFFELVASKEEVKLFNRSGDPMTVLKLDITVSAEEFQAIQKRFSAFPTESPLSSSPYTFPPFTKNEANCATFPAKVGVPMPDSSGQVKELIKKMKEQGAKPWKP